MGKRKPQNEVAPPKGGAPIVHGGGKVFVYPDGRIWSFHHAKFLKCGTHQGGYKTVGIGKKGERRTFYVHDLVLRAFDRLPLPGEEVRHLDGNPANNAIGNLAWGSSRANKDDQVKHGTACYLVGTHNRAKLKPSDVLEIRAEFSRQAEPLTSFRAWAARRFDVTERSIEHVINRRTWKGLRADEQVDQRQ